MRTLTLGTVSFSLAALLLSAEAYAAAEDIPAQVCERDFIKGGPTPTYDYEGVRNDTTTAANVVCPIVLVAATGRTLFIGGTDQNASKDFFCGAHGWDINLNSVSMPSITSSTGTYTNGTVGAFNIPDNVFKLEIDCTIPAKASNPSKIGDFFIQH